MFGKFCGPTIVSFIYFYGGIFYTFLLTSISLFISIFFLLELDFKSEEQEDKAEEIKENFFTSISKFEIFTLFFCQFLNLLSKSFYGHMLFFHMNKKFNISIEMCSFLLSLSFASYYFVIYYIDRIIKRLIIGILLNFLAVNLLFPISILPQ